ncbi:MAG TPA: hypothetical protein VLF68_04825 [Candidatus Saccharimonadales bacterium]|nr:hypothetical protein [Candidatus Saccharimonadales bacterium]
MLKNLKGGLLDDALDQVGKLGSDLGAQIKQAPQEAAKTVASQISPFETGDKKEPTAEIPQGGSDDQDKKDLLKAMYGPSETPKKEPKKPRVELSPDEQLQTLNPFEQKDSEKSPSTTTSGTEMIGLGKADPNADLKGKTPEEQEKIIKIKQEFAQQHKEKYYDPTFNRPAAQPQTEEREKEQREKQETQQQRMQRLEQEDLQKKKEEEKKKEPPAVLLARQKTEKMPGAG